MRIMIDSGIVFHSEFAEVATQEVSGSWGEHEYVTKIPGLMRREPGKVEQQRQKEALFTIGRLIREERIEAYTYAELTFEQIRGRFERSRFNALENCNIRRCCPAIERSKFFSTTNFEAVFRKGGKKDIPSEGMDQIASIGLLPSLTEENIEAPIPWVPTQIASIKFLLSLTEDDIEALIPFVPSLSQFEIDSLRSIRWFQLLCERFAHPKGKEHPTNHESYPDAFHLWTCERNSLDAFLTLDTTLQNTVDNFRRGKKCRIKINTQVLQPLEVLEKLGIQELDPVPIEAGRFYRLF